MVKTTKTGEVPPQTTEVIPQTMAFQAEVKQLLHLMIHSLYSNKEIAVREIISNASDALDKMRFEALSGNYATEDTNDLHIRVDFDQNARTLTIRDNGIGMSREEVINNIGTIARSGTKDFLNKMSGDVAKDANLIGQFGVGFYSAFVLADKVTLLTRRAGETSAVKWESNGEGEYTLEQAEKASRGTDVVLHIRPGEGTILDDFRLRFIIRHYSDHIVFPIVMQKRELKDNVMVVVSEHEVVNKASALWARPKTEIVDDDYKAFYEQLAQDTKPPLAWSHNRVEGDQEYISLLFIPSAPLFDLYDRERRHGVKLYVKRVFVMEDTEKLLPQYLRFVRGVIDSADLPLNVSREMLQEHNDAEAISNGSAKRILSLLEDLAEKRPDDYQIFWKSFGRVFKEGINEDFANQARIIHLLRFSSTHLDSEEQTVSFKDYISRMPESQKAIYYIVADSFAAAKNSPHLEIFRQQGVEVLLLCDRLDEWMLNFFHVVDGLNLVSIAKGDLKLDLFEKALDPILKSDTDDTNLKSFLSRIKESLGKQVKDVRATQRLVNSPACLVVGEGDISVNLTRLLNSIGQKIEDAQPTLEINLKHKLIQRLQNETTDGAFADLSQVLFDQALLAEGGQLKDPAAFVRRVNQLMV